MDMILPEGLLYSVNCELLYGNIKKFGCPEKYVDMVKVPHTSYESKINSR